MTLHRGQQRRKKIRVATPLGNAAPVRIQEQRRFFSTTGNDKATRDAAAISKAFNVGVEFIGQEIDRRNLAGGERALEQMGAGGERDSDDTNAEYHRKWDLLDDERSLHLAAKEIPEMLRESNWDDLDEAAVQDSISEYMAEQFNGIDMEQGDHTVLAIGLLELEAQLIAEHRDTQIMKVKEAQRSDILANAKSRIANSGDMPYKYIAEQTNIFFDGAEKRKVYWEMIYELGIEAGSPDSIRNVPERFPNGDPTGINDPLLADAHRAAIRAATIKEAAIATAQDAVDKDAGEKRVMDLQIIIAQKSAAGEDTTTELNQLRDEPEANFADFTSATNFGQGQQGHFESRSADPKFKARLWEDIYNFKASIADVMTAFDNGQFGTGEQATDDLATMMSTIRQIRSASDSFQSDEVRTWRAAINKLYNPRLDGPVPDLQLARVNVQANLRYNALIADGVAADKAYRDVRKEFDHIIETLPTATIDALSGRQSQQPFEALNVTTVANLKRVAAGEDSFAQVLGGVSQSVLDTAIMNALDAGDLSDEEAAIILGQSTP